MPSIYTVGTTHYGNYVDAAGQRVRRSLDTKDRETAKRRLALIVNEVQRQQLTGQHPTTTPSITLTEFSTHYLQWHESEYPDSSWRVEGIFRKHLLPVFGELQLNEISPVLVEGFKARQKKSFAAATIKKQLDALKAALNRAVKWELLQTNRIAGVAPPRLLDSKPPRFYTKDELQAIYDNAIKYGALWRLVANTGLRRGEILKARRRDIVGGCLRVESTHEARTKSGKFRIIPLSPGALEALEQLPGDYLAPRMYPQSLSRAFVNDAGSIGGSLHVLRHTFCSMLVMAGVDLRTVQELAGHAHFETTLQYSHLSNAHLSKAVLNLNI